tara:strand:- start:587 stop:1060 length:474 start_codon:yes stop_codon:yes gene_type:complete
MGNLVLNGQTVLTQTGTNTPEIANPVLNKSFTALDTSASQGPGSNADNTALPLFGCRAWVRFHGTTVTSVGSENHCLINGSGNVSKAVRSSTGQYKVYFQTPMPDANYAAFVTREPGGGAGGKIFAYLFYAEYVHILAYNQNGAYENVGKINCLIMR